MISERNFVERLRLCRSLKNHEQWQRSSVKKTEQLQFHDVFVPLPSTNGSKIKMADRKKVEKLRSESLLQKFWRVDDFGHNPTTRQKSQSVALWSECFDVLLVLQFKSETFGGTLEEKGVMEFCWKNKSAYCLLYVQILYPCNCEQLAFCSYFSTSLTFFRAADRSDL